jgi:hypothetical protein
MITDYIVERTLLHLRLLYRSRRRTLRRPKQHDGPANVERSLSPQIVKQSPQMKLMLMLERKRITKRRRMDLVV